MNRNRSGHVSGENGDVAAQDKKANWDGKDIPENIEGLQSKDRGVNDAPL